MNIYFSPQRRDDANLTVTKEGDKLTINRKVFDFSVIPDTGILPAEGADSEIFAGDIKRENDVLSVILLLPYGPNAPHSVCFPGPLMNVADGVIPLPTDVMKIEETADEA